MASEAGLEYFALPARGFDRGRPMSILPAALTVLASTFRAVRLLARFEPDVVVGFGGYVALPLGLACAIRRVPLVLHEQNSVPGLANRVLARWAKCVAITYPDSGALLPRADRTHLTGNPVRDGVLGISRPVGRARLSLPEDALVVFAFGGSRGARHLNESLVSSASALLTVPGAVILHVAGPAEYESVREAVSAAGLDNGRYVLLEWLDDIGAALAATDVVVSRAGASAISEITAVGRAAVLVPYPYATDDHQTSNARAVVDAGGAVLVPDADLDGPALERTILGILRDAPRREKMAAASQALGRPEAAGRVAELARECAGIRD